MPLDAFGPVMRILIAGWYKLVHREKTESEATGSPSCMTTRNIPRIFDGT